MANGGEYSPVLTKEVTKEEVVHKTLKYNLESDRKAIDHWLQCHKEDIELTFDDKGRIDTLTVYGLGNRKVIHKVEYQN